MRLRNIRLPASQDEGVDWFSKEAASSSSHGPRGIECGIIIVSLSNATFQSFLLKYIVPLSSMVFQFFGYTLSCDTYQSEGHRGVIAFPSP
jgi:hypothetical protein